jgi:hypothetical protein
MNNKTLSHLHRSKHNRVALRNENRSNLSQFQRFASLQRKSKNNNMKITSLVVLSLVKATVGAASSSSSSSIAVGAPNQ